MFDSIFHFFARSTLLFVLFGAGECLAQSTPAFWRVESPTTTLWLLGSMHFGTASFYPLPAQIEQAFAEADVLAVEVDITRIAPAEALSAITRHGRLTDGETLSTVLSPETLAGLKLELQDTGIPFISLERFKPWFAALQLVEAEIRKTEFEQQYGIDQFFLSKAGNKEVVQLETLDVQLGIFSDLTLTEQEQFLKQTLGDIEASETYLHDLAEAWKTGDVQRLEVTLLQPFAENPDTRKLYQTIFTDRNLLMANQAEQWLRGRKPVFLVVGAGHLIGEAGIVSLLRSRGFVCTRLPLVSVSAGGSSQPIRPL